MPESKRIERRVMNGGGPVVLAVELTACSPEINAISGHEFWSPRYYVDGAEVYDTAFQNILQMLAMPQKPAL